jgi:two-component system, NtrC family, response regulator AtoC
MTTALAPLSVEPDYTNDLHHIPEIVVIDEDVATVNYIRRIVGGHVRLHPFSHLADAAKYLTDNLAPDLVFLDCNLSDDTQLAFTVFERFHKEKPWVPVIMLSCSGDTHALFQATQFGAAGFILKPSRKADIDLVLRQEIAHPDDGLMDMTEIPLDVNTSFVRASQRMRYVESQCRRVAPTDIPVLILGESGTGKEIAAKFIHKMSTRSTRTFLKVNCAAMPLDLLESELFGYEQGAFTGAVKSKPGKFELCSGGTIFLDEIGEMPSAL